MDNLHFAPTKSTPEITFDATTGELRLTGESYPENSFTFYQPILSWLTGYLAKPDCRARLVVHLTYMNTGTTKIMMDILDRLEDAHGQGRDVSVEWRCERDNDRIAETAEEFKEEFSFPFAIATVE